MTENNTTFKSTTNETVRAPVRLEVGAVSTSVEITADAAGVEIEFGSVQGGGTNRQLVESIPNMTIRSIWRPLLPGLVGREELSDAESVNSFGIGVDGWRKFSAISVSVGQAFTRAASCMVRAAYERPCKTIENPVGIENLHTTTYHALGIPADPVYDEKRPVHVTRDGKGRPIAERVVRFWEEPPRLSSPKHHLLRQYGTAPDSRAWGKDPGASSSYGSRIRLTRSRNRCSSRSPSYSGSVFRYTSQLSRSSGTIRSLSSIGGLD